MAVDLYRLPKLRFYNFMLALISRFVVRFFKLRAVGLENVPKTGPYVICANHSHLLDPFFIGALIGRPLFQMASNEYFRKPLLARFMWAMGAFPRKKGFTDIKSIKYAIRLVKAGFPLIIYPEGGRNWDGETLPAIQATAKLVKHLKVPLVTVVSKGNYIAWPRWADKRRKSPITVHYEEPVLFDESISEKEIIALIERGIYNNDNYTPIERVRGRNPALGLPRLLWRCPSCRTIDALFERDGRHVECASCAKVWEVNQRSFMRVQGEQTWRAIKEYSDLMFRMEEIKPLPHPGCPGLHDRERVYLRSGSVTYYHEPRYPKIEKVATGTLFLTDIRLVFVPRGKPVRGVPTVPSAGARGGSGPTDAGSNSSSTPGAGLAAPEAGSFTFERIRGRSTEKNIYFQVVLDNDIARFQMHEESCYKWELYYDYVRKKGGYSQEVE
jgi:1-acyl-sn-glycerol-3-phosphate acyltransferase